MRSLSQAPTSPSLRFKLRDTYLKQYGIQVPFVECCHVYHLGATLFVKDRCSFEEIYFSRLRFDSKKIFIAQDWNRGFHLRYTVHHHYTTKLILPETEKFSYIMQIKKKTKRKKKYSNRSPKQRSMPFL